ncbi:MAG TPA: HEAT repeat domain-containing protein [Planctomycetota bacterium]|nr:HEAT repeat domain-containing protein [Planctomycetota bacterium]
MLPLLLLLTLPAGAQEGPAEAELAVRTLRPAAGLQVTLFAAEPQLQNPSSFTIDEKGRFFVVETHRRRTSVLDVRSVVGWLDEDLACRTVEDRIAMHRRHLGADVEKLAVESEKIKLIEDRSGSGRADHAETFAEGFNSIADGVAAGILARKGEVWFAAIPNLWRFKDGKRNSLHYGFGIRQSYGGHDFHGLRFGPDGKLYMSVGDRGCHVETAGRVVALHDEGGVLRCNPDGSDLEIVATGLRNPQELAFNEVGDLFTVDNNANVGGDNGETARIVHVVEGGDNGWRIGYQHLPDGGPWDREDLWKGGGAYQIPPLGHLGHGPAGLTHNPGTGLPPKYEGCFLLCDFPGGVHSFRLKAKGATYELAGSEHFLWDLFPTDVEFGVDGAVYVTDWVQGFEKSQKGRIFRVADPALSKDARVLEVRRLLSEGMAARSPDELAALLGHIDQRVRMAAQFELAGRREEATLAGAALKPGPSFGRLHAIWGLGQIGAADRALPLLDDADAEVRAQAARVLGDGRASAAGDALVARLKDANPRVRYHAAMALGKLKFARAHAALVEMIRENDDRDRLLRHAGVMALAGIGDVDAMLAAAKGAPLSVRLAVVLALRRMGRWEIRDFLEDRDLRFEAARAINDTPIPEGLRKLSMQIMNNGCPPPLLSRAINASFRLGDAGMLARFISGSREPPPMRAEALRALADWEHPSGRDRITGVWRALEPRDPEPAREALRSVLDDLLQGAPLGVQVEALRAAAALGVGELEALRAFAGKGKEIPLRVEALRALAARGDPTLGAVVREALAEDDEMLRGEVVRLIPKASLADGVALLERAATDDGPLRVRQAALLALAESPAEADAALSRLMDRLLAGTWPAPLRLELLEAAARRASPGLRERAAAFEGARKKDDPLSPWRECLEGGDAGRGRQLFWVRVHASCHQCHRIGDEGGTAGPALTGIGARQSREVLLESLLFPSKAIAPGYETVAVLLENGAIETGRVLRESDADLVLREPDGREKTIAKASITKARRGLSAMPDDLGKLLTRRELRDLVEYLATQK